MQGIQTPNMVTSLWWVDFFPLCPSTGQNKHPFKYHLTGGKKQQLKVLYWKCKILWVFWPFIWSNRSKRNLNKLLVSEESQNDKKSPPKSNQKPEANRKSERNYLQSTIPSHCLISPYSPEFLFLICVRRYWRYYFKIFITVVCSVKTSIQTCLQHSTEVSESYYGIAKCRNPHWFGRHHQTDVGVMTVWWSLLSQPAV